MAGHLADGAGRGGRRSAGEWGSRRPISSPRSGRRLARAATRSASTSGSGSPTRASDDALARWFSTRRPSAATRRCRRCPQTRRADHWFFDGWRAAREQLQSAGVPARSDLLWRGCARRVMRTVFCSYRRDGSGGRPAGRRHQVRARFVHSRVGETIGVGVRARVRRARTTPGRSRAPAVGRARAAAAGRRASP